MVTTTLSFCLPALGISTLPAKNGKLRIVVVYEGARCKLYRSGVRGSNSEWALGKGLGILDGLIDHLFQY